MKTLVGSAKPNSAIVKVVTDNNEIKYFLKDTILTDGSIPQRTIESLSTGPYVEKHKEACSKLIDALLGKRKKRRKKPLRKKDIANRVPI